MLNNGFAVKHPRHHTFLRCEKLKYSFGETAFISKAFLLHSHDVINEGIPYLIVQKKP